MNDTIALRPLRNVLLDAEFQDGEDTIVVRSADVDRIAGAVFATIDASDELHPFRAAIAKNFTDAQTDWLTGGGTDEELDAARATFAQQLATSLASAYTIAGAPDTPLGAITSIGPAPLPANPTLADLRKWTCAWNLAANLGPFDIDQSNVTLAPAPRPNATGTTDFEIALFRFQRSPTAARAEALGSTPIARVAFAPYEGDLEGLDELAVTLDLTQPLIAWCAITRNSGADVNPAFVYRTVSSFGIEAPVVTHDEPIDLPSATRLPSAPLDAYLSRIGAELLPADPTAIVAAGYVAPPVRVPIALVPPGAFDAKELASAILAWLAEEEPDPPADARLQLMINGEKLAVTLLLPLAALSAH